MDKKKHSKMLSEAVKDDRFAHILQNPVYRRVPKREKKVDIDKRFKSMFHDKNFKLKYHMDKRGRPIDTTSNENLKRLYNLASDEDSEEEAEEEKEAEQKPKNVNKKVVNKSKMPAKNVIKPLTAIVSSSSSENSEEEAEDEKEAKQKPKNVNKKVVNKSKMSAKNVIKPPTEIVSSSSSENSEEEAEDEKEAKQKPKNVSKKVVNKSKMSAKNVIKPPTEIVSSSSSEEDDDGDKSQEGKVKKIKGHFEKPDTSKKAKVSLTKEERKKLHRADIDYTRGEGIFAEEESSSDESTSCDEELEQEVMQEWGEMDKDAARTEEPTTRLALCNMDWDRLSAEDLMVLFHSFVPSGGVLKAVTIYPSEFGKERLAEEELHGPKELVDGTLNNSDDDDDDEDEDDHDAVGVEDENGEGSGYNMEKLRTYQLKRLKYYYAVLEFDSKETADKVYTECDGMEYESSATRVDLRFVPEDMTFDDEPRDKCDAVPNANKYRPRFFVTTALQQVKVDLTWDETDPKRRELIQKIHDPKEKIDDEDINAYLAQSSSESENENEQRDSGVEEDDDKDPILKYKSLLQSIEDNEKKKEDKDVEMEITWGVGLKEKSEQLVKKKLEEKEAAKMTPWEEMLAKRREKRKTRKSNVEQSEESGDSDDDDDDAAAVVDNKAELELLMDEQDTRKHFSLKKIMESESTTKKNKKKNKKKENSTPLAVDAFEVNLQDDRFSALYTSHHYNVDPSDPGFKKTKGMQAIITEKQKRRHSNHQEQEKLSKQSTHPEDPSMSTEVSGSQLPSIDNHKDDLTPTPAKKSKAEISYLIKSIKGKTQSALSKKQNTNTKLVLKKLKDMKKNTF